jgi:soluble lytic murein transglycosylase-like protein
LDIVMPDLADVLARIPSGEALGPPVSADTLKRRRAALASALAKDAQPRPMTHWAQALAQGINAAADAYQDRQLAAQEAAGASSASNAYARAESERQRGMTQPGSFGFSGPTSGPTPTVTSSALFPVKGSSFDPRSVPSFLATAGDPYGVSSDYLTRVAHIESRFDPNASNPSGAKGLFQFVPSTARQYALSNPYDPVASADAAARLAADNRASLRSSLGREPTDAELYLAHQQGAGGAAKLLANPDARAGDLVGDKAVRSNGGNPNAPASAFSGLWTNKYNNTGARTADAGGAISGEAGQPTMTGPVAYRMSGVVPGSSSGMKATMSSA